MQRIVSVLFVSLVLAGAWPCPAWAGPFTFTIIGPDVLFNDINRAGQIVGNFECDACTRGFLLTDGNFTPIAHPDVFSTTIPWGINDAGQIVGGSFDSGAHAFLLSEGTFTTIDHPDGSPTVLSDINDAGQIVGYFGDDHGDLYGFVATPVVPEPGTLIMLSTGLVGLLWRRSRRPRRG